MVFDMFNMRHFDNPIIQEDGSLLERRQLMTAEEMDEYDQTTDELYAEEAALRAMENRADYEAEEMEYRAGSHEFFERGY